MEVGLLAAFLGGVLALLSPCGALLLPAFFASTVGAGPRLLLHGAVFYVGLALTLVPLGIGAAALGSLLVAQRDVVIAVAGLIVIALGVWQALGRGFDLARLVPGVRTASAAAHRRTGIARTFLLGTASGVAGFCAGPILGAVLTLAATGDSLVAAGTMLAVYGAGMVLPLLVIAAVWARRGTGSRRWLRGRALRVGPLQVHSTSLVTGLLLIGVGIVFIVTNGMTALPEIVPASALARLQSGALALAASVGEQVVIALLALLALLAWWLWTRHGDRAEHSRDDTPADAPARALAAEDRS